VPRENLQELLPQRFQNSLAACWVILSYLRSFFFFFKPRRTTDKMGTPRACEVCEEFTHFGPEVGH
jgi:hypothetical protein